MAAKQLSRRSLGLILVTVAAAAVLVAIWPAGSADIPGSTGQGARNTAAVRQDAIPPPVGLDRLSMPQPAPGTRRDLFGFGQAQPDPAEQQQPVTPGGGTRGGRRGAQPPPPPQDLPPPAPVPQGPPPIPLRYVAYIVTPEGVRMAGLSDGYTVIHAREGAVVEGQWRVVRISEEAIVIERLDGSGRQTIRNGGG